MRSVLLTPESSAARPVLLSLSQACAKAGPGAASQFWAGLGCAISLAVLIACVLAPVASYDFVNWDDGYYLIHNDLVKSWRPANLYRVLTETVSRNYAPLTIATFLVEHTLWGLWPGGYHLTNVLLHLANTLLVLALLRRWTGSWSVAWFVAAVFAVHPVQVEAVAWISSRKTVLSALCMLAGGWCWLRPERSSRDEFWGNIWLVLGLLSKASTVVLPLIVVAYDVLIVKKKWSESLPRQVLPLFFCVLSVLLTMDAQVTIIGGVRGHLGLSKLELLAVDATLMWRYVSMLLWPQGLSVLYDPPFENIPGLIAASLAGWVFVGVVLWKLRGRYPWALFAAVSWTLLFLPMIGLFPLTTLMNDRYLYLPLIAFWGLIAAGAAKFAPKAPAGQTSQAVLRGGCAVMIVGIFAALSADQLAVWKDSLSLWGHARSVTPQLAVVQIQWALSLEAADRHAEAKAVLRDALQRCPADEIDRGRLQDHLQRLEALAQPAGEP